MKQHCTSIWWMENWRPNPCKSEEVWNSWLIQTIDTFRKASFTNGNKSFSNLNLVNNNCIQKIFVRVLIPRLSRSPVWEFKDVWGTIIFWRICIETHVHFLGLSGRARKNVCKQWNQKGFYKWFIFQICYQSA